jgi:hypothetical protein
MWKNHDTTKENSNDIIFDNEKLCLHDDLTALFAVCAGICAGCSKSVNKLSVLSKEMS